MSQLYRLAGPYALVGGEDDAQRMDSVAMMLGKISLAADRLQKQALLAIAQVLMAGLVARRFDFVGLRERAVGLERRVVDAQRVGLRVRGVIGGTHPCVGLLFRHNRDTAF